jgi:hypothetical protein
MWLKDKKNCPVNSHVGASKFIFLHKTKKYFSLKLVCEHRMFGCTYKKSWIFLYFQMYFQTMGPYVPGSQIRFLILSYYGWYPCGLVYKTYYERLCDSGDRWFSWEKLGSCCALIKSLSHGLVWLISEENDLWYLHEQGIRPIRFFFAMD